jgi:hypothetical protein
LSRTTWSNHGALYAADLFGILYLSPWKSLYGTGDLVVAVVVVLASFYIVNGVTLSHLATPSLLEKLVHAKSPY